MEKGQFSIEYLIAFIIFSIIILYISFQVADFLPEILTERIGTRKESEAERIATFLAETEAGFADKGYLWNERKIDNLRGRCNDDYYEVLEDLGLDDGSGLRIVRYAQGESTDVNWVCVGPRVPEGVSIGTANRFGYIEDKDEIYKMEVVVW